MIELIFKFFFLIYFINSQEINELNPAEYNCIENVLTKLGTISYVKNFTTIQGYNFCISNNFGSPVYVSCPHNKTIEQLSLRSLNQTYIVGDEFSCFSNLRQLTIINIKVSIVFFDTLPSTVSSLEQSGSEIIYGKLPPTVYYYNSNVDTQTNSTNLKFSWYTNLNLLYFSKFFYYVKSDFTFENDLDGSMIWKPFMSIFSTKVPSFRFIGGTIVLNLITGYDQSSWSNISFIDTLTIFDVSSYDKSLFPSIQLSQLRSNNLTKLTFDMPLNEVQSLVDLSSIGKLMRTLSFVNVGRNFTISGGGGIMPIILPTNQAFENFQFCDGFIETLNFSLFENVQSLKLSNNLMLGSLPPFFNKTTHGKLKEFDISKNLITGTIDDSYCELDIFVSNNSLNGTIPSCFTCFFGLSDINLESRFIGNSFINLNQSSSPSIIVPNLVLDSVDNIYGIDYYNFLIFGENIGGNWVTYENIISKGSINLEVLIPNKLFSLIFLSNPPPIIQLVYSKTNQMYNFTLSTGNTPPQLNTVDWRSNSLELIFDGSFFTYNKSIVNITIGNDSCLVTNTTFYQINCKLSNVIDSSLQDILSFIIIGNLTTQFTLNPGVVNQILNCTQYNDCNGGGYYLSDIGECKCDSNHQGDDCSIPFAECLNECNNNIGQCNNQTGICLCPTNPYVWSGVDCSIPLHTLSAVLPSNTKGGNASIYGWFGNIHSNLQVFIGIKECKPIYNTSEFEIKCNAPAGTGLKSVSVIQNSINVTAKDIYQYYSTDKTCPNDCTSTSNGICNTTTGYCNCIGRWSGYDCSLFSNPSGGSGDTNGGSNNGLPGSNSTIDSNTGGNITNQQTNYQILITKLVEIDFSGKSIKEYTLLNKWTIYSNNSKMIYTFIQSIQNDQSNITYTIEEINKDREISFADVSFKLTSGSVKMTVSIENYQYSSNLNTLQLQMKSSVNEIQTNGINDCNNDQIEIDNKSNQDNSLNYIAIKKDAKVLNGRFIDRIESDGKSTFMQTVLVSKSNDSIIVGMNLPHCVKKCLIDPDFSVLISPEFTDECDGDKRKSWFLPVVVVVPIVAVAAIISLILLIYRKRFIEMPLKTKLKVLANKK